MKRMAECHPDRPYWAKGLCRQCYSREAYKKKREDPKAVEQLRIKGQIYYRENKEKVCKRTHEYYLKKSYDLSPKEYNDILEGQGGVCAICSKTPEENGKRLAIDHDHETGQIRGLLCSACNLGLGQLGDMLSSLWPVIRYLSNTISFKKMSPDAVIPSRKYEYDAGLDIHALETNYIPAREQAVIRTGIALANLPSYFSIQIWSKSGLDAKLGLHVGAGIVDPTYRGEILILLKNMSDYAVAVEKGDAIAQLVIVPCMRPEVVVVEEIETTDRGEQGGINDYGSRG